MSETQPWIQELARHVNYRSALAVTLLLILACGQVQAATDDKAALAAVLANYNEALNASSTERSLAVYADDGVFMPPFSQSAVGKAAVKEAYDRVFKAITLHVTFTIAEIVLMAPDWAFVRTNSAGTNKVKATGKISAEGNQELFVFKKDLNRKWKIERYSFSPTGAPHG